MKRPKVIFAIWVAIALIILTRAVPAFAEPGSSVNRLPSDDAAGPEWTLPTWAGLLIFFVTPVVLILIRAAILDLRAGRRTA